MASLVVAADLRLGVDFVLESPAVIIIELSTPPKARIC